MKKFFVNKTSLLLHIMTLLTALMIAFLFYQQKIKNKESAYHIQQMGLLQEVDYHISNAFQLKQEEMAVNQKEDTIPCFKHLHLALQKLHKMDSLRNQSTRENRMLNNKLTSISKLVSQYEKKVKQVKPTQGESSISKNATFTSFIIKFNKNEAELATYLEDKSHKIRQSAGNNNLYIFGLIGLLIFLIALELYKHYNPGGSVRNFFRSERLNENEEFFKAFFRYNSAAMLLIDPETGEILDCNLAAAEFYGYSKDTLSSMHISEINTQPEEKVRFKMKNAVKNDQNHFFFTHQLANGTRKDVEVYSSPLTINNRRVLFSIIHDITDRRLAEQTLQTSEKYYRELFENAHDAVIIMSPRDEKILDANQRACEIYGFPRGEFIGKSMKAISKDIPTGEQRIQKTLEKGVYNNFETIQYTKAGEELTMEINASVVDYKGRPAILSINRDITQRKKIVEALRTSEEKFRQIFTNAPIGIFRSDFKGKFSDLNPAAAEMFAYDSPEQMIMEVQSIPGDIYVNPDDRQRILNDVKKTGEVQHVETTFKKRNNDQFEVLLTIYPVKDKAGNLDHLEGIVQDITTRKRAERFIKNTNFNLEKEVTKRTEELNRINNDLISEIEERKKLEKQIIKDKELWRRSFKTISEGIYLIDTDFNILDCNKAFGDIIGDTPENLIGKKSYRIVHGTSSPPPRCISRSAIAQKKNVKGEFWEPFLRKYIYTSSDPVLSEGKIEFSINTLKDITEEKKYQKALKKSEEKFRTYIENAPIGIFLANGQGRYLDANPEGLQLLNYTMEELLNYSIPDIVHESEKENVRDTFQSLREHGNSFHETKLLTSRGETVDVFVNAVKLEEDRYLGFVLDISDRKKAEANIYKSLEREKELNEMKTRFISMVSHEFRTPLANIYSNAQLLERFEEKWNREKKGQSLERIQNSVQVLNSMLDDVSLFGKKQSGKLKFNPVPVDFDAFISSLIDETLTNFSTQRHIKLVKDENVGTVHTDKFLLHHIVTNLLSNALKYSSEETEVLVKMNHTEYWINLTIQDHGKGIPEKELTRIFEPFYRASNIDNVAGTGLGMAIIKHCTDLLKGKLHINSEIGIGTTVSVNIPVSEKKQKENVNEA